MPKISKAVTVANAKALAERAQTEDSLSQITIGHLVVILSWLVHNETYTSALKAVADVCAQGFASASATTVQRYVESALDFIKAGWKREEMFTARTGRSFHVARQTVAGGKATDKKLTRPEIRELLKDGSLRMAKVHDALGREKTPRNSGGKKSKTSSKKTAVGQLFLAAGMFRSLREAGDLTDDQTDAVIENTVVLAEFLSTPSLGKLIREVSALQKPDTVALKPAKASRARASAPKKRTRKTATRRTRKTA